jgi:hypothetical protein
MIRRRRALTCLLIPHTETPKVTGARKSSVMQLKAVPVERITRLEVKVA